MVEKVSEKERVIEVHEAVALVQPRSRIDRQVKSIVGAPVGLVNFLRQLLLCVLVRNVAHHHVGPLVVAHPDLGDVILANHGCF